MPDKLEETEFRLLVDIVVDTVEFGAFEAVTICAGPVASLFDRRGGCEARRRAVVKQGAVWEAYGN